MLEPQVPAAVYAPMPLRPHRASLIAESDERVMPENEEQIVAENDGQITPENDEQVELQSLSGSTLHSVDIESQTHNQARLGSTPSRIQSGGELPDGMSIYGRNTKKRRWPLLIVFALAACTVTGIIVGIAHTVHLNDGCCSESTSSWDDPPSNGT